MEHTKGDLMIQRNKADAVLIKASPKMLQTLRDVQYWVKAAKSGKEITESEALSHIGDMVDDVIMYATFESRWLFESQ